MMPSLNLMHGRDESRSRAAEIAKIKDELERHTIVAPFSGVVVREFTELGQWLAEGGPVVELMALDEMDVVAEVPERYFNSLKRACQNASGLRSAFRVASRRPGQRHHPARRSASQNLSSKDSHS